MIANMPDDPSSAVAVATVAAEGVPTATRLPSASLRTKPTLAVGTMVCVMPVTVTPLLCKLSVNAVKAVEFELAKLRALTMIAAKSIEVSEVGTAIV